MRVVKAEYVDSIPVPDSEDMLHIWKNPESGNLVAIDNMNIPAERNSIIDPYDEGVRLVFHDTFSGLPK